MKDINWYLKFGILVKNSLSNEPQMSISFAQLIC